MEPKFTEKEISKRLKKARPITREEFFKQLEQEFNCSATRKTSYLSKHRSSTEQNKHN